MSDLNQSTHPSNIDASKSVDGVSTENPCFSQIQMGPSVPSSKVALDLGQFLFPRVVEPTAASSVVPVNHSDAGLGGLLEKSGGRDSPGPVVASTQITPPSAVSVPKLVFGGFPVINGSGLENPRSSQIPEGSSSLTSKSVAGGIRNLLKNPVPQKSSAKNPVDMLARFPESMWNEAAVIVAEILKIAPSGGSSQNSPPLIAPPVAPAPFLDAAKAPAAPVDGAAVLYYTQITTMAEWKNDLGNAVLRGCAL
ncbi:hypothetical protein OROMI_021542 [Orobanche minor]